MDVCFIPNEFVVYENGSEVKSFSPLMLSFDETVLTYLEKKVGKEKIKSFLSIHKRILKDYEENLDQKLTYKMTENVVANLSAFNEGSLSFPAKDCFQKSNPFDFLKGLSSQAQMQCQLSVKDLPQALLEKLDIDDYVTGKINLHKLLKANLDTQFVIRSRALSKAKGEARLINSESIISVKDYFSFELTAKTNVGEVISIGSCYDYSVSLLSPSSIPIEGTNFPFYDSTSVWDFDSNRPSGIRLADDWYMPVRVGFDQVLIRDKKSAEAIDAVDVNVDAGVTYRLLEKGKSSIDISPSIGIPVFEGLTGPRDALTPSRYNLDMIRPDKITLDVIIRW